MNVQLTKSEGLMNCGFQHILQTDTMIYLVYQCMKKKCYSEQDQLYLVSKKGKKINPGVTLNKRDVRVFPRVFPHNLGYCVRGIIPGIYSDIFTYT